MRINVVVSVLAVLLALSGNSMAQTPAVTSIAGGTSYPDIDGTDRTVGWSFVPSVPLSVSSLGLWESNTGVALNQTHQIGLWNAAGALLASATVLTNSPVTGSWRYVPITPVVLSAGTTYIVGSAVTSPYSDQYSRVPATGGSVTTISQIALGTSYSSGSSTGFAFPNTGDATYLGRFGPNLLVNTVTPTPIPISSWASLGVIAAGLAGLAMYWVWRGQAAASSEG